MHIGEVRFDRPLHEWDGSGATYVQAAHTYDYRANPQDYGGFDTLSESQRMEIVRLVFGDRGWMPGVLKVFLDPLHQPADKLNADDRTTIDPANYDHQTSTESVRFFIREGLKLAAARGERPRVVTTLFGPPPWMTVQQVNRGRDLDRRYIVELAKYMVSWVLFLRENDGIEVDYISINNEGDSAYRWNEEGLTTEARHDYNLYWPPELIVEFIPILREVLDGNGLHEVGITPGENTTWNRFADWGNAFALYDDERALADLGLITSHGFYGGAVGSWSGDFRSFGIDLLRQKRPELHAWTTSISWRNADVETMMMYRDAIYAAKTNALLPWAFVQRHTLWPGGDPNPKTAITVSEESTFQVQNASWLYRQLCIAGRPGTHVCRTVSDDWRVSLAAFGGRGTPYPDAFVVCNNDENERMIPLTVTGSDRDAFALVRTTEDEYEQGAETGTWSVSESFYTAPAKSVTTFMGRQ
jgi:O-glycosyl hydrolase